MHFSSEVQKSIVCRYLTFAYFDDDDDDDDDDDADDDEEEEEDEDEDDEEEEEEEDEDEDDDAADEEEEDEDEEEEEEEEDDQLDIVDFLHYVTMSFLFLIPSSVAAWPELKLIKPSVQWIAAPMVHLYLCDEKNGDVTNLQDLFTAWPQES